MKKFTSLFLLTGCMVFAPLAGSDIMAQSSGNSKMSSYTQLLIRNVNSGSDLQTEKTKAPVKRQMAESFCRENGQTYLKAFITKDANASFDNILSKGVSLRSTNGDIAIALIPIDRLNEVAELDEVVYIEASVPLKPNLDVAKPAANVDSLQNGIGFSQQYRGQGTVVGLVDIGFDFTHPNFYNASGTDYRVSRVQVQNSSTGATSEYTSASEIRALETDNTSETHGTHTTGIAGGGGYTTAYMGVAPESELILVATDMQNTGIAEGVQYIFDNAGDKPCVVNLSLGGHIGPHDGTTSFETTLDNISKEGRVIVVAAGNEGGTDIHLQKQFSSASNDTIVRTILNTSANTSGYGYVDIWGRNQATFDAYLKLIDQSGATIDSTEWVSSTGSSVSGTLTDGEYSYEVALYPSQQASPYSNYDILIQIQGEYGFGTNQLAVCVRNHDSGLINMWGTNFTFSNENQSSAQNGYVSGDDSYTVGIPGTAKGVITVGAYCTKNKWMHGSEEYSYDPLPTLGEIASFSSIGPTADNRIKPDLSAPGFGIVSSYNSYAPDYTWANSTATVTQLTFDSQDYCWGMLQGTSMACPMVTGSVALLLEAKPDLDAQTIKEEIFARKSANPMRANKPQMTFPNNTWGVGVLDATQSLKAAVALDGIDPVRADKNRQSITVYPNPVRDQFNIVSDEPIQELHVYDITGRLVLSRKFNPNTEDTTVSVSDPNLGSGIYTVRINGRNSEAYEKMIVR